MYPAQGWTGQTGHAGGMPSALCPDYQLFSWARWWGFAFAYRVEDGKCTAAYRDGRGELVTSSWCDIKLLLADDWCERPVDAAPWLDDVTGRSPSQR
jgi:hypothetical protein